MIYSRKCLANSKSKKHAKQPFSTNRLKNWSIFLVSKKLNQLGAYNTYAFHNIKKSPL